MAHIPLGYKVESGKAVIDEETSKQVRELFVGYLSGLSLKNAAKEAGLKCHHATAGRVLTNKKYLGDDFYPPLIDKEVFEKAGAEKLTRAGKLGRIKEPEEKLKVEYPKEFTSKPIKQKYKDLFRQAEYAYSLIESEV